MGKHDILKPGCEVIFVYVCNKTKTQMHGLCIIMKSEHNGLELQLK